MTPRKRQARVIVQVVCPLCQADVTSITGVTAGGVVQCADCGRWFVVGESAVMDALRKLALAIARIDQPPS
jgi:transcription elongation factor Elf1